MHLVPSSSVLYEHRCSECHILIKDANEILLVISALFVRVGKTSLEEICAKLCGWLVIFMEIGGVKPHFTQGV